MGTVADYLAGVDEPDRTTLAHVVDVARDVVPDATEGTSYGMPALLYRGKALLSAMASAQHLAVYPFSPAAVTAVEPRLDGFSHAKGTVRFSTEHPLPDDVVRDLVATRVAQIDAQLDR
ncbi:iron chaperone [Cellulosimicrobium protaetiae]|uniref:DUF1801 domain-containing protein n=1 Tax=Cellulosimicrobium protaetiae TaxID=2587808 RepID=A0A6M5UAF9_9MICO|nr:DUF1801 domain-containing protein [Cellulosimicrobium protaetiae]QJW35104.1 DUF1801 domain-containing protein [Cellulosimicrobium protaetiae]